MKTRLGKRIEDEFLAHNLVIYVEKEIAKNFNNKIINRLICFHDRLLWSICLTENAKFNFWIFFFFFEHVYIKIDNFRY